MLHDLDQTPFLDLTYYSCAIHSCINIYIIWSNVNTIGQPS